MDHMYSGNLDLADRFYENGDYGTAEAEYRACKIKTEKYNPKHTQRIRYCEEMIKKCERQRNRAE